MTRGWVLEVVAEIGAHASYSNSSAMCALVHAAHLDEAVQVLADRRDLAQALQVDPGQYEQQALLRHRFQM